MAGAIAVVRTLRTPYAQMSNPPGKVRAIVRSSAAGAQIMVDGELCGVGKCELELKAGLHQAEVRRAGYTGETREFAARAGVDIELNLQPLPQAVEVVGDLTTGELRLDNQAPVALSAGGALLTGMEPGEHRLQFSSGGFWADFKFEVQPGTPPRLLIPPAAGGLRAVVVAGAGSLGRIWTTDRNAELAIGARELGLIPEEGLALPALERGAHRFVLKLGKGQESAFAYERSENPTAWISLRTNRKLGTLRILTAADDAKVILDGKDSGARIRRGKVLLLTAPGIHEVSVEKAGFITPPEQRATVRESGETDLEFNLDPVPTRAMLPVAGAPDGTALAIDDKPALVTGVDGSALLADLTPGVHVVTGRRDGYLPGRWEVKLSAGRNPALRIPLQRAPAILHIATTPPGVDAKLTLRRMGQFEERPVTDTALKLTEGEYTVNAVEANGRRHSVRVRLEAGKEAAAAFALGALPVPGDSRAESVKRILLTDWDGAPGWAREGERIVSEGGGIMLAPTKASAQSLTFTAHVAQGKAVRWVTQFRDADNYTLYEYRGDGLNRTDVVRGKRISRNHSPFSGGQTDPARIRMNEQSGVLRTSAFVGGQWVDLDTVDAPNGTGRFGFYLFERDRLALSEFRYEYR